MSIAKNTTPTKPVGQFDSEKGHGAVSSTNGTIDPPSAVKYLTMDDIRAFLERGESDTVDFKGEQYQIIGNSKTAKKEVDFLKDVLAMANTPREMEAFILIGVKEKQHSIPGISVDQVIDASTLNGKIKAKTNIQVPFRSYTVPCESGNVVQVIAIPPHGDLFPFYSTESLPGDKPFIKANTVYYREGTSNTEASLEDVVRLTREWFELRNRPSVSFEIESPNRMSDGRMLTFDLKLVNSSLDPTDERTKERIRAAKTGLTLVKAGLVLSNHSPLHKANIKVRMSLSRTEPWQGLPVNVNKVMTGKWWEEWRSNQWVREEEVTLFPEETRRDVCPIVFDTTAAGTVYLHVFLACDTVGVIVDKIFEFEIVRKDYVCDGRNNEEFVLPTNEESLFDLIKVLAQNTRLVIQNGPILHVPPLEQQEGETSYEC